jgi:ribosome maturation factor RimP
MFGSAVSLTTKTRPMGLLREFCGHLVKPSDETVTLFADGRAVEIPVF